MRPTTPALPHKRGDRIRVNCGQLGLSPLPFGKHRAAFAGPPPRLRVGDPSALLRADPLQWGRSSFPPAGASCARSVRRLSLRCRWRWWQNGAPAGVALPRCRVTHLCPVSPAGRAPPPPPPPGAAGRLGVGHSRGHPPTNHAGGTHRAPASGFQKSGRCGCISAPSSSVVSRLLERVMGG